MKKVLLFIFILLPVHLNAEQVKLKLKITEQEATSYHNKCGKDCTPWSYWYRYKATVQEVLEGAYSDPSIVFVNLQHAAYIDSVLEVAIVTIKQFDNQDTIQKLGTKYYASEMELPILREIQKQ